MHHQQGQRVGHHVVHVTGDPHPLGRRRALGQQGVLALGVGDPLPYRRQGQPVALHHDAQRPGHRHRGRAQRWHRSNE
nr:hypothetical protein [Streptomyces xiamenensis]